LNVAAALEWQPREKRLENYKIHGEVIMRVVITLAPVAPSGRDGGTSSIGDLRYLIPQAKP
jgi:hypothetical protein